MGLKKDATSAFVWDYLGSVSGFLIQFVISIILAKLLTPSDFGVVGLVSSVLGLSSIFLDSGLSVSIIQRKEVNDSHYSAVFSFNVTSGLILTLLIFSSAGLVADFYNKPILVPIVRAMAFTFLISSFGNVIRARLRKELKNRVLVQGNLLSSGLSGVVGITMAFQGYGLWSLIVQSLLKTSINNIFLYMRTSYHTVFRYDLKALKELWSFGFRVFLSGIMESVFKQLDSLIIGKLFPMSTLGQYYRARSFNDYITKYTSASLMSILFPVFSKVQDDLERFKRIIEKSLHLVSYVTFGVVGLSYVIGDDLLILLFSQKWEPATKIFRLILLTGYAYPISAVLVNIINGMGNSKAFLKLEVIKKILLVTPFIFGFQFGLEGFLYSYAFVIFIAVILNFVFAAKQIGTSAMWLIKMCIPYTIITIIMVVLFRYASDLIIVRRSLHFTILLVGYTGIYLTINKLLSLPGFNTFNEEFLSLLKRLPFFKKKSKVNYEPEN